ncbi:tetratricopeptide repeat protein [Candidatus Poribacteria bacterium]|nr:tetratricopeptide repeat protein [Candidatus Poribacteria bacterium]
MDEKQVCFGSFKEIGKLLPVDKYSVFHIGIQENGRFKREERRLRGLYEQAIEWFQKLLSIESDNPQALNGLGITYREMGDYAQAIEWFQKLLSIEPASLQALDGLGITYREMGDYEQAIEWFQKLLNIEPDNPQALNDLGITYRRMGRYEEAVKPFKRVLELHPDNENALDNLAQTYREIEVELLRSRQMATLGVMASGLAHEINQPLQIILATAQNCAREVQRNAIDTKEILSDLERIATNTKRIDKIVNHLHFLVREHEPRLEAVDINTVIENSFIMFHQQLKSRGIKIERSFSPDLPPVKADMVQLEQVFINLINNARDALEGRSNKIITISTLKQNGYIQVRFQDNGVGIVPENLPKIFDAFFTTKQDRGGMGLGLYIAQDIIQSLGSTITVDSRVNEGTTFLIKLPIAGKEDLE